MKKKIQSGLLALVFLASCSGSFAADFKIATVDLRKVFDSYYKTIQASLANSNSIAEHEKEFRAMVDERRKRADDWQEAVSKANDQAVSAEERAKYKKAVDDIVLDLQIQGERITNYLARTDAKQREDMVQHVADLTTEITNSLAAMAKKQGYTLVLDRTALTMTGNPMVLYTSGENDLTEPLIKELNSTAPATPAPEPPNPGGNDGKPAPATSPPK